MNKLGLSRFAATGAAAVLSSLACASPVHAGLVVASSGPSAAQFPTGKKLEDDAWVTLESGDQITVLDQRGTRVLRGPGRFSVSKPGRVTGLLMRAAFMRTKASQRVAAAAVRNSRDGEILSPNLWYVDLRKDGPHCIVEMGDVRLWRPEAGKAETYAINRGSAQLVTARFDETSVLTVWDEIAAPTQSGIDFTILDSRDEKVRNVSFETISQTGRDYEKLAEALIDKGCLAQLGLLSATLAID